MNTCIWDISELLYGVGLVGFEGENRAMSNEGNLAGFQLWIPPKADVYDDGLPVYEILGTDAQIVQFPLRPQRSITCFSGAMAYMSDGVKMDVKLAGLKKTFGRLAGGGSLFQLTYTNTNSNQDGYIAVSQLAQSFQAQVFFCSTVLKISLA